MAKPSEPTPASPPPQRYTDFPFPAYRFVPGRAPHPRRHVEGHAFGTPEFESHNFDPDRWWKSEMYLYGVDLYNYAYWWECHEQWEAIWKSPMTESRAAEFLQGLVQIAAANLRRFMESHDSGAALAQKGLSHLKGFEGVYLGIEIERFRDEVDDYFAEKRPNYPVIVLRLPK